jgi:hypothetical protein
LIPGITQTDLLNHRFSGDIDSTKIHCCRLGHYSCSLKVNRFPGPDIDPFIIQPGISTQIKREKLAVGFRITRINCGEASLRLKLASPISK